MKEIKDYLCIVLGAILFGFGVSYFIIANDMAEGGFTGIAIIVHYLTDWPAGTINLSLNAPLLVASYFIWGKRYIVKTIVGIVSVSISIDLFAGFGYVSDDLLIVAICAGVVSGAGIGLVYKSGGTTGGADILAQLAHKYFGMKIAAFLLIFDFTVLVCFASIFGLKRTLYSLVMVFVFSKTVDFILSGLDRAKQLTIISHKTEEIYQEINDKIDRGGTFLMTRGGYTKDHQNTLIVVVSRYQLFRTKVIIKRIDSDAFVIVTDVYEALGEGFLEDVLKK